jgi:hypothetical protein
MLERQAAILYLARSLLLAAVVVGHTQTPLIQTKITEKMVVLAAAVEPALVIVLSDLAALVTLQVLLHLKETTAAIARQAARLLAVVVVVVPAR